MKYKTHLPPFFRYVMYAQMTINNTFTWGHWVAVLYSVKKMPIPRIVWLAKTPVTIVPIADSVRTWQEVYQTKVTQKGITNIMKKVNVWMKNETRINN